MYTYYVQILMSALGLEMLVVSVSQDWMAAQLTVAMKTARSLVAAVKDFCWALIM